MPFSFKPTQGTETQEANPKPSPVSASSFQSSATAAQSLSYGTRFGGGGRDTFQIILLTAFALCVVTSITLFGYQQYLTSQVNNKKALLAVGEEKLGTLPLDGMRKLSNRIKVVDQLIKEHASVRVAFRIIEDSIENPVTYKNFDLHFSESSNSYELGIGAVAMDYHSVIQQIETFKNKTYAKYIPSIIVEGLRPDDTGKISFNIKMPILITGILPEEVLPTSEAVSPVVATSSQAINNSSATSTVISNSTSTNILVSSPITTKTSLPKKP